VQKHMRKRKRRIRASGERHFCRLSCREIDDCFVE